MLSLKTLTGAIAGTFQRIQFTPGMLPADVVGTHLQSAAGDLSTKNGPVFANIDLGGRDQPRAG